MIEKVFRGCEVFKVCCNKSLFSRKIIQGGSFGGRVTGGTGVLCMVVWVYTKSVVGKHTGYLWMHGVGTEVVTHGAECYIDGFS